MFIFADIFLVFATFFNCCIIGFCNKFYDTHFIIWSNDDLGAESIGQPNPSAGPSNEGDNDDDDDDLDDDHDGDDHDRC